MNAAPMGSRPRGETKLPSPGRWPLHRWWLLIALVFAAHVGLIFALGDRRPMAPRPPGPALELQLAIGSNEWLALNDPTLFALPHPRGFTAAVWRQISHDEFPPFRWAEPPRWLALPVEQLGDTLRRFGQTNTFARFDFEALPAPDLASPAAWPETTPAPPSGLRVAGDLARRELQNPIQLPSWSSADLLTNSVVQVLVDAAGNVVSHTLLHPESGSKDPDQQRADERALELARAARFAPLPPAGDGPANPLRRLSRGALIFEWRTVARPATNAPPAKP
jgi:hypothetical protein